MGQGTNLTTSDLPCFDSGIKTYGRVGRLNGNTNTANAIALHYNMESQDCYRFIGKTVTLSFYYRTGANFSATNLIARIGSGTGTDQALRSGYAGYISQASTSCTQNTSWSRVSLTCILGTTINQIGLNIEYYPTGTALAADYFDVTGVQLELGSVATPFEVRPYPVELGLCQRYYCAVPNINGVAATGEGRLIVINNGTNASLIGGTISFPATMRASPAVTFYGGNESTGNVYYYTSGSGSQVLYTIAANTFGAYFYSSTGLTFSTSSTTIGANYSAWIDMGWIPYRLGLKSECEL
jgi:hypothetical protein